MVDFIDIVGLLGVGCILVTYFLLQASLMKVTDLNYSVVNGIGAILILYSLFYNWNTASVVIEIFWFSISLFGIITRWKQQKTNSSISAKET